MLVRIPHTPPVWDTRTTSRIIAEKIFDVPEASERERSELAAHSDALSLPPFKRLLLASLIRQSTPVRSAVRSSLRYMVRSKALMPSMPELSVFCMITALEEGATAVVRALDHRGYDLPLNLRRTDHVHKAAIWYLIEALMRAIGEAAQAFGASAHFRDDVIPGVEYLGLRVKIRTGYDQYKYAYPIPPLSFALREMDLLEAIRRDANSQGAKGIGHHLKRSAAMRNKVLYAAKGGIPVIELGATTWDFQMYRWTSLLMATLLISQEHEQQLFVKQSIALLEGMLADWDALRHAAQVVKPGSR